MAERAHVFQSTFHFHEENNDYESANKMSQEFLETNKAIALRLVEIFNGRRLDLPEDVLHPEFGHYYGKYGFDMLTHAKSMLISPPGFAIDHLFPPYTAEKNEALKVWFEY